MLFYANMEDKTLKYTSIKRNSRFALITYEMCVMSIFYGRLRVVDSSPPYGAITPVLYFN